MVNSNSKGDRGEREIVNWLTDNGWAVVRSPSSGSATDRDLPDIIAGNGTAHVAAEVKRLSDGPAYVEGEKVADLQAFAADFGATPYIAVKFDVSHGDPSYGEDRPGFYFVRPKHCPETDGGNYRVKEVQARTLGTRESDL